MEAGLEAVVEVRTVGSLSVGGATVAPPMEPASPHTHASLHPELPSSNVVAHWTPAADFVASDDSLKAIVKAASGDVARVGVAVHRVASTLVLDTGVEASLSQALAATAMSPVLTSSRAASPPPLSLLGDGEEDVPPVAFSRLGAPGVPLLTNEVSPGALPPLPLLRRNSELHAAAQKKNVLRLYAMMNGDPDGASSADGGEEEDVDDDDGVRVVAAASTPPPPPATALQQAVEHPAAPCLPVVSGIETVDAAGLGDLRPPAGPPVSRVVTLSWGDHRLLVGTRTPPAYPTVSFLCDEDGGDGDEATQHRTRRDPTDLVPLRMAPSQSPFSALTQLDLWIDQTLNPVVKPRRSFDGVADTGYAMVPTPRAFNAESVTANAAALLGFLRDNCTDDDATYWMTRDAASGDLKLFRISHTLRSEFGSSSKPLPSMRLPLAMLCLRSAEKLYLHRSRPPQADGGCSDDDDGNAWNPDVFDAGTCQSLYGRALELVPAPAHGAMWAWASVRLASVCLPGHAFPSGTSQHYWKSGHGRRRSLSLDAQPWMRVPPPPPGHRPSSLLDEEAILLDALRSAAAHLARAHHVLHRFGVSVPPPGSSAPPSLLEVNPEAIDSRIRVLAAHVFVTMAKLHVTGGDWGTALRCLHLAVGCGVPEAHTQFLCEALAVAARIQLHVAQEHAVGRAVDAIPEDAADPSPTDFWVAVGVHNSASEAAATAFDATACGAPVDTRSALGLPLPPLPQLFHALPTLGSTTPPSSDAGLAFNAAVQLCVHAQHVCQLPSLASASEALLSNTSPGAVPWVVHVLQWMQLAYDTMGLRFADTGRFTKAGAHFRQGSSLFSSLSFAAAAARQHWRLAQITFLLGCRSATSMAAVEASPTAMATFRQSCTKALSLLASATGLLQPLAGKRPRPHPTSITAVSVDALCDTTSAAAGAWLQAPTGLHCDALWVAVHSTAALIRVAIARLHSVAVLTCNGLEAAPSGIVAGWTAFLVQDTGLPPTTPTHELAALQERHVTDSLHAALSACEAAGDTAGEAECTRLLACHHSRMAFRVGVQDASTAGRRRAVSYFDMAMKTFDKALARCAGGAATASTLLDKAEAWQGAAGVPALVPRPDTPAASPGDGSRLGAHAAAVVCVLRAGDAQAWEEGAGVTQRATALLSSSLKHLVKGTAAEQYRTAYGAVLRADTQLALQAALAPVQEALGGLSL